MLLLPLLLLSTLPFATAASRAQSSATDQIGPVNRRQPGPASLGCTRNAKGHITACAVKVGSAILDFKPLEYERGAPDALYCDGNEKSKGQIVCKEVVEDCEKGASFGPFARTYEAYACGDRYPNYADSMKKLKQLLKKLRDQNKQSTA